MITAVALSPDHKTVLTGCGFSPGVGKDGRPSPQEAEARLWDATSGQPRGEPLRCRGIVWALAFSPDGKAALSGSGDGSARLWDVATGRPRGEVLRFESRYSSVNSAVFSPDGLIVATGHSRDVKLWDVATGRLRCEPLHHQGPVRAIAFSPDGGTIMTGTQGDYLENEARLWDAATGRPRGGPLRHRGSIHAVAFSPDGHIVLIGGRSHSARDAEVGFWDIATGQPLGPPLHHQYPVDAVAFGADGKIALTGGLIFSGQSWETRFWDVPEPIRGDAPEIALRTELLTGLELDAKGAIRQMSVQTWQHRRELE
jgi:WD40 repeat protein